MTSTAVPTVDPTPAPAPAADVLSTLAVLAPAYTRRILPGEPVIPPPEPAVVASAETVGDVIPCAVEAVVVIDAERRIPWPCMDVFESEPVVSMWVHDGMIEVAEGTRPGAFPRRPDHRGRLRLSPSTLRAAGITTGCRMVIVRVLGHRLLLVPADRLGLRLAG